MRYIIGIDLGTTNTSVAYVDTHKPPLSIQLFPIPQLTSIGVVDYLFSLPSFCYLSAQEEWPKGALTLPWKEESISFVGQFAKTQGARAPTRLVQSAKSWLCNVAANRRDKILPIEAADVNQRLSPVEASAKYLTHIKNAWNHALAKGDPESECEEQEIVLTVPASFDEVARALTVEAARLAGFRHVALLEEPQAAFYSWISQHEKTWRTELKAGDTILVCDVGGGTTDFSLIEVEAKGEALAFQRMAVGDHLLLGGDNMDASLAYYLEQKIKEAGHSALESVQWLQLQAEARAAKEQLLTPGAKSSDSYVSVIQGGGSSVVKDSLTVSIQQAELERFILDGFFGRYSLEEARQLKKSRGFRTMGLPYEDEPSIAKHLARFLQRAYQKKENKTIDYLLFNGGTMKPASFQRAIQQSLYRWFPDKEPVILTASSLDLAVARGAAYYGKVRRGLGVAIGGGLARAYYLEIEVKDKEGKPNRKALALLPRGSEENAFFQPRQTFLLRPNQPVSFHLLTSNVRLFDRQEDLIDIDEQEMHRLPPIQTILRFGRRQLIDEEQELIPVRLSIKLTAVGTIELWVSALKTEHKWNLEFQLRAASGQENSLMAVGERRQDETFESQYLDEAKQTIQLAFSKKSSVKPERIMEKLEELIGMERGKWSSSLLRSLWEALLTVADNRKISMDHEARWWNLAGFFLRPGFGFPLDDFRMKELWKIILGDKTAASQNSQIQKWICYRRVSGGLSKGQQTQLSGELTADLFDKKIGRIVLKNKSDLYAYSEKIRALASFERVDLSLKVKLGDALVERLVRKEAETSDYWALARIGARHLVYGSAGQVVPRETCKKWVERLLKIKDDQETQLNFALSQLARKTEHRELNLPHELTELVLQRDLEQHEKDLILNERPLTSIEQEHMLGDSLPAGLILEI